MEQCIRCGNTIKGEFFEGQSGSVCKDCLKDMQIYRALQSMVLIKEIKEDGA